MGIIELYFLFSLTTAIVGAIQIYRFVHRKLEETNKENIVTKAPVLSFMLFLLFGFITAPFLIWILIIPGSSEDFIKHMYESIIT